MNSLACGQGFCENSACYPKLMPFSLLFSRQIKELFVSFEDTPLGAASLAQVHKAVLQDGRTVAVKIQHPKVQAQSSKDILLMEVNLPVDFNYRTIAIETYRDHVHSWF